MFPCVTTECYTGSAFRCNAGPLFKQTRSSAGAGQARVGSGSNQLTPQMRAHRCIAHWPSRRTISVRATPGTLGGNVCSTPAYYCRTSCSPACSWLPGSAAWRCPWREIAAPLLPAVATSACSFSIVGVHPARPQVRLITIRASTLRTSRSSRA